MTPLGIKVGVTTWGERTLVASGFYPPGARSAEARLRYYATQFSIVENDMTYYARPERRVAEQWCARTPDGFTMNVKAFALLTGHYASPRQLPPELRARLPRAARGRERVYPRHVGDEVLRELERLGGRYAPFRVAVALRNATWFAPERGADTLRLLAEHQLVYTCVDEPQGLVSSVPPIAAATRDDVALVRRHGRARARWQRRTPTAAERFAYKYTRDELREWLPRLGRLQARAREVHVLFNNCYSDYAVSNARDLLELLSGEAPEDRTPGREEAEQRL